MTAEEIVADVLALLQSGKMEPAEALSRLIAAGVDANQAEALVQEILTAQGIVGLVSMPPTTDR